MPLMICAFPSAASAPRHSGDKGRSKLTLKQTKIRRIILDSKALDQRQNLSEVLIDSTGT